MSKHFTVTLCVTLDDGGESVNIYAAAIGDYRTENPVRAIAGRVPGYHMQEAVKVIRIRDTFHRAIDGVLQRAKPI